MAGVNGDCSIPQDWFFVKPLDVLFFRDGRSFEAGEGHVAQSIYPPLGRTVWGAIRGAVLRGDGVNLREYGQGHVVYEVRQKIGTKDDLGPLEQLVGPFIARRVGTRMELYFPPPEDLVIRKDCAGSATESGVLAPLPSAGAGPEWAGRTDLQPLWLRRPGRWESLRKSGRVLCCQALQAYLNGLGHPCPNRCDESEFRVRDRRAGNALQENKVVRESYLYELEFVNPRPDCGLAFGLSLRREDGALTPQQVPQRLQLGGESKWATAEALPSPAPFPQFPAALPKDGADTLFKVYLAGPAKFERGWLPCWLSGSPRRGSCRGVEVELVAAAIAGQTTVGGFDLAAQSGPPGTPDALAAGLSRGSHAAVAAGSVYFFTTKGSPDAVRDAFHCRPFADCEDDDDSKLGLGLGLVGGWNYA